MRFYVLLGIFTVCLALSSSAATSNDYESESEEQFSKTAIPPEQAHKLVSSSTWKFAVNLYKNVSLEMDTSFVLAPLNLAISLAMTSFGSYQYTRKELFEVLGTSDMSKHTFKYGYAELLKSMKQEHFNVRTSNFLAIDPAGCTLQNAFFKNNAFLEGKTELLIDGKTAHEPTTIMKKWVADRALVKTMDMTALNEIILSPPMRISSELYFKGCWSLPFDPTYIEMKPFWYHGVAKTEIPTMFSRQNYRTGKLPEVDATFVELPYQTNSSDMRGLSMFIILPNEYNGLPRLEANLELVNLAKLYEAEYATVDVFVPKFDIENYLSLEKTLQAMGLRETFTENVANFKKICPKEKIRARKVAHMANVEMTPEGCLNGLSLYRMIQPDYHAPYDEYFNTQKQAPVLFEANHPFLILVTKQSPYPVAYLTARFTGH